jgi:cytochrome P450
VLATSGGPPRLPNASDMARLPYARMVVAEALRLYPPAWALGRRAIADVEIGGFLVPAGSLVIASAFITQRDARWWPDPERFDPERWTPDETEKRPKFAYYPFGGGTRICLGEHFAWMEAVILLSTIASRWRLRLVPGHRVDIKPLVTLRPKYGMMMTAERR